MSNEEENVILFDESDSVEQSTKNQYIIVGRLLTEKPIKFNFSKETLAGIWRSGKGMRVKDLAPNLFLLQFFYQMDMDRILEDVPWSYKQSMLVMKKLAPHESPFDISLTKVEFWVQIHNLLVGFCSKKGGESHWLSCQRVYSCKQECL